MKTFYLFFLTTFLFFMQFSAITFAVSPDSCEITSTLRLGSKGGEVVCLQNTLGGLVADGNFGQKTKNAVIAFQTNAGLTADGVFGPKTREMWASRISIVRQDLTIFPAGCTGTAGYSVTTGKKCDSVSSSVTSAGLESITQVPNSTFSGENVSKSINPNLTNLDQFIATVMDVNKKAGKNETELKLIASAIREEVKNSKIDYKKEFEKVLENDSKLSALLNPEPTLFGKIFNKALSFLGITPPKAYAAAPLPFGGRVLAYFSCAYNDTWMITITPLPPTLVKLLSYVPGTQLFASFNIPFTGWLKGFYIPPGVCMIPAGPVPIVITTEGFITPIVGSSPTP